MSSLLLCLVVLGVLAVLEVEGGRTCGLCYCRPDVRSMICDGIGLTEPPPLTPEIKSRLRGIGLQRNSIRHISREYLEGFPQLEELDVSAQGGCVSFDADVASFAFRVIGGCHLHCFVLFPARVSNPGPLGQN